LAPQEGTWVSDYKIIANPTFSEAISAVASMVFAYAGTPAFFSIVSEMRDPKYYTRSLIICQSAVTVVYITIGVVVYYFCGSYVASPALGSAGVTMKKISYGFAIPGLLVTVMLFVHVSTFFQILHINYELTPPIAPREIHLRPRSQRLQAPHLQQHRALGFLDRLHRRCRSDFLHHCQRHSRL
jgi:amino acid transporter